MEFLYSTTNKKGNTNKFASVLKFNVSILFFYVLLVKFEKASCRDTLTSSETSTIESHIAARFQQHNNHQTHKSKYLDVWHEQNEPTILNCSLRVNKDQHVVWHRKYDKVGVHVLTIGSETFISDLRIRPIKQEFNPNVNRIVNGNSLQQQQQQQSNSAAGSFENQLMLLNNENDVKYTWNLEIRRLRKDDSAMYYCVLNSENAYGQFYRLNVLSPLKILNKTELVFEQNTRPHQRSKPVILVCKYGDLIQSTSSDQIKWFFNKIRLKTNLEKVKSLHSTSLNSNVYNQSSLTVVANSGATDHTQTNQINNKHNHHFYNNHYSIIQTLSYEKNETISTLIIHNFNIRNHAGRYKCQYKGLVRTVRLISHSKFNDNSSSSQVIYKQSVYSMSSSSSSSSSASSLLFWIHGSSFSKHLTSSIISFGLVAVFTLNLSFLSR